MHRQLSGHVYPGRNRELLRAPRNGRSEIFNFRTVPQVSALLSETRYREFRLVRMRNIRLSTGKFLAPSAIYKRSPISSSSHTLPQRSATRSSLSSCNYYTFVEDIRTAHVHKRISLHGMTPLSISFLNKF